MATALGTYATLTGLKSRLAISHSTDDGLLQTLCDQIKGWIESYTSRPLAPLPNIDTTLNGGVSIGATSVTLTSASGVSIGDALMLGPVSGTHEHGIVIAVAGNVVTFQAPLLNAYSTATVVVRVYIFDGDEFD